MTSSEKKIEARLKVGIEKVGGMCLKFPATFFAGIPDRLIILPGGLVFFVEVKGEGLKLRPRQLFVAKKIEALGIRVYVANSEAMVSDLLAAVRVSYVLDESPGKLTGEENAERWELQRAREEVKSRDSSDDLGHYDLKILNYLMDKH